MVNKTFQSSSFFIIFAVLLDALRYEVKNNHRYFVSLYGSGVCSFMQLQTR